MNRNLKKCFAIDHSGSTSGIQFYHDNVKAILDEKYKEGDDLIIWDHIAKFIPYNEYMEINKNRKGDGGTYPNEIFRLFKDKEQTHYSEFILITDGLVGESEVKKCDQELKNFKNKFIYDYAEVYLIGNSNNTDLSVGCPFTRFCPSKTVLKSPKEEKYVSEISSEDLKIEEKISSISTKAEFNQHFESLKKGLIVRLIGTSGDVEIKNNLLLMLKRIEQNDPETDFLFSKNINLLIRISNGAIERIFHVAAIAAL